MENNKNKTSFRCSKVMTFCGIALIFGMSILPCKEAATNGEYFFIVKLFFMNIITLYFMSLFSVKTLSFEKEGIDMFYCLRPLWRHYRYKYGDINIVICECGRTSETLYIKVKRHYPLAFVKNKCLFFQCKSSYETKDIVSIFKKNNINVVFRGDKRRYMLINEKTDGWN